jgi:TonB-linked SusC/RagA family outer membrane protein
MKSQLTSKCMLFVTVITMATAVLAQQRFTVTGKVTANEEAIIGASVMVKGTSTGTITDVNGFYNLAINHGKETLVFSFIGYSTQEIEVKNQHVINVTMSEDVSLLDEVVVVGYGSQRKKDLTGAITRISTADSPKSVTTISEMLRGSVAGLTTSFGTEAAGGGSLLIRGARSINASNSPLIVLDGVIFNGGIADINPADVESVDILKDGSAAAVYGAQAASGVIVISTKQGKEGKPKVNFDLKIGTQNLTRNQRPFDGYEYTVMRHDERVRSNPNRPAGYYDNPENLPEGVDLATWLGYTDATADSNPIEIWLNRLGFSTTEIANYLAGKETDWYDESFQNPLRQDYTVSLSGKSERVQYYWSLGYLNNEGLVVGDAYQTFRSRLNLKANVTDWLQVGLQAHYATRDTGIDPVDWAEGIQASPWGSKYEEDGTTLKHYPNDDNMSTNPFSSYLQRDRFTVRQTLNAVLSAKVNLPFGFDYEFNYSDYKMWQQNHYFDSASSFSGMADNGHAVRRNSSAYSWILDNILRWNRTFNEVHKFDLTLLFNLEKNQTWSDQSENSNLTPSDVLGWHEVAQGTLPEVSSNDAVDTGNAMMARLNYNYRDRYLFTASIRRDGYSAFGQDNPYANFPALAFGWRLSEEKFMKPIKWVDNLKLRLSWGINGNRSIGRYAALANISTQTYLSNGSTAIGIYSNRLANSKLKWEKTTAYNVGIDFSLLKNRLAGSVELYYMSTKDLLLGRALPDITGFTSITSNLGEIRNRGFEFSLNSINIQQKNFKWSSSLVTSLNRNEIAHLYGEMVDVLDESGNVIGQREDDDIQNGWYIGHALDEIYNYKILGVWQEPEREEAAKYGKEPGDFKIWDINGDYQYLPEDDKVFQGFARPRISFGLGNTMEFFRCLDLYFFLRSDIGHKASNANYAHSTNYYYDRVNAYKYEYWTPENPTNEYARLGSNVQSPSFSVYKYRTFIRLQEIALTYRIPSRFTAKWGISNARLTLDVTNPLLITKWDFWDPESQSPAPRTFTFGINFTL